MRRCCEPLMICIASSSAANPSGRSWRNTFRNGSAWIWCSRQGSTLRSPCCSTVSAFSLTRARSWIPICEVTEMNGRLQGKIAIIVGAGQSPGQTIGNGRAMAILFARHGAQVLCVDRDLDSATETTAMIAEEGGSAAPFQADVSRDADCATLVAAAKSRWERIDILVNNVGIGGGGDGPAHRAEERAWDLIITVNLKSAWMTIKHTVPIMREQGGGSIVNISSLASLAGGNQVAYEVSKAGMNRLTTSVANANAGYGVRCNAVLP